jgi:hypothetical protein
MHADAARYGHARHPLRYVLRHACHGSGRSARPASGRPAASRPTRRGAPGRSSSALPARRRCAPRPGSPGRARRRPLRTNSPQRSPAACPCWRTPGASRPRRWPRSHGCRLPAGQQPSTSDVARNRRRAGTTRSACATVAAPSGGAGWRAQTSRTAVASAAVASDVTHAKLAGRWCAPPQPSRFRTNRAGEK